MVVLLKEFEKNVSCTIEEVSRKVKESDYPLSTKPNRLCELAEALSSRTEILFIRHKTHPEKSWILLQMDVFLTEIHGRIFAPKNFPKSLEASETGVVQWSQILACFSDFPDPNLVVAFLGHFEECKIIDDPEVLVLIDEDIARDTAKKPRFPPQPSIELPGIRPVASPFATGPATTKTPSFYTRNTNLVSGPADCDFTYAPTLVSPPEDHMEDDDEVYTDSPSVKSSTPELYTGTALTTRHPQGPREGVTDRVSLPEPPVAVHMSPRREPNTLPSGFLPGKYLFIPGLISADYPSPTVWKGRQDYTLYSGWCLQCTENKFFEPRFLQALLLRLTFGFAVSQPTARSATARPTSLIPSKRECTLWKNGIRWLSLDGIEVIVEFVEDRTGILLLMRAKDLSKMKCVKLRSQLIQKILEAKSDYCPTLETSESLIDPKHIEESHQYPVISKPLKSLSRYDITSVAEAFMTRCKIFTIFGIVHVTIILLTNCHLSCFHYLRIITQLCLCTLIY